MNDISTKEVFDLYFSNIPPDKSKRTRPQVDRPELYAYEEKLGKRIFDMDVEELIEMLKLFNNDRKIAKSNFQISYTSIGQIVSGYRSIWDYYIDKINIIKNPWNDKRMKGESLLKRLSESREKFTYDTLSGAIENLYNEYPADNYNPKYIECLLLLFYDGFAEAKEIVELKEDMINFKTKEVRLAGRTVSLSDRCFELLQYVHNLNEIETQRGTFIASSYHGGYFKFIVRKKDVESLQNKTMTDVCAMLTSKITIFVRRKFNIDINYRMVYLLGFFNYIVNIVGEERAEELITSIRNSKDAKELMVYAKQYGFDSDNISYIKKCLRPFV